MIDDVTITVQAGNGGHGAVSFSPFGRRFRGGPDGGDGGKGGDVYIVGSTHETDLQNFLHKKRISAKTAGPGGKNHKSGKNGEDTVIVVPLGTDVYDLATGEVYEITDDQSRILIARGGTGGRGNTAFKSATHQAPRESEPGEPGEEKQIRFNLRLIAQVGLIGMPNAGKSSLIRAISAAKPAVAPYPFTTLEPVLGVSNGITVADIPGLIEGASEGKGLGLRFLKHIEKTRLLVHCIDITGDEPLVAYDTVRKEFARYDEALTEKPEIIVLTKSDLVTGSQAEEKKKLFLDLGKTVFVLSSFLPETLGPFMSYVEDAVKAPALW